MSKLFYLAWVPGLFWLFPFAIFKDDIDIGRTLYVHGLYSGIQIFLFVYFCFM